MRAILAIRVFHDYPACVVPLGQLHSCAEKRADSVLRHFCEWLVHAMSLGECPIRGHVPQPNDSSPTSTCLSTVGNAIYDEETGHDERLAI